MSTPRDPYAARFAQCHAKLRTVAVTGTNGKTTTVSMVDAIARAAGEVGARLTTLGAWVGDETIEAPSATLEFLGCVERAVELGAKTLALETTSKALGNGIARKWRPDVGVFTNLTRDHLDLHQTPEAYLASKAQLFLSLGEDGVAVFNADDPASALLAEVTPPAVRQLHYAIDDAGADAYATRVRVGRAGTTAELHGALRGTLRLRTFGRVHVQNALGAGLAMHALGIAEDAILAGLASFEGVPGRFEVVGCSKGPLVVVDYAHTPDGLRTTLETARTLAEDAQVVCVFGCGGERDRGKRAAMGTLADTLADVVVLTDDNPRREDPATIRTHVRDGETGRASWSEIPDRERAIEHAITAASPRDVVVIAGKGHEAVQIVGTESRPFSDAEVARAVLERDPRLPRSGGGRGAVGGAVDPQEP